jgi:hypothetical protein
VTGQLHASAAFLPEERTLGTHWIGSWVDPRTRNLPGHKWQPVRKADNLTDILSQSARKCGNLNVSHSCGPPRPVTGTAYPLHINNVIYCPKPKNRTWKAWHPNSFCYTTAFIKIWGDLTMYVLRQSLIKVDSPKINIVMSKYSAQTQFHFPISPLSILKSATRN